jgi:tripartite-type tricarboxylate transporter receptor subunit TctC
VPVVAGGNLDIITRAVADKIAKGLGQSVIVDNRPSASSLVGTQLVAKSPPDGYTLLSIANTFVAVPAIVSNAGYDPVKEFAGVSLTCTIPMVLLVHPDLPARNIQEFAALCRAKPGEVTYATAGSGSTGHIAAELFSRMVGAKMLMVPYKGNAQAINDLVGGQVMAMFDQVSTAAPFVQSGKLTALGVTTLKRSALFPDVPTIDEAGVPGYEDVTFNGLLAPAGTAKPVLDRLHREVAAALASEELRERFLARGIELAASPSPAAFSSYIADKAQKYVTLAREANIKSES